MDFFSNYIFLTVNKNIPAKYLRNYLTFKICSKNVENAKRENISNYCLLDPQIWCSPGEPGRNYVYCYCHYWLLYQVGWSSLFHYGADIEILFLLLLLLYIGTDTPPDDAGDWELPPFFCSFQVLFTPNLVSQFWQF